jgi:hypothetical protein
MTSRRGSRRSRRGSLALESVLTLATFYTIACLSIRLGSKACALFHHAVATLVGWPII